MHTASKSAESQTVRGQESRETRQGYRGPGITHDNGRISLPGHRLSRHLLAAYFSDARLNIFVCLADICTKSGITPRPDEAENIAMLESLALTTATVEEQQARMCLLRQRFPFLSPMTDPAREQPDAVPKKPLSEMTEQELRAHKEAKEARAKTRAEAMRDLKPADFQNRLCWLFGLVHDLRNSLVHVDEAPPIMDADDHKHLFRDFGNLYDVGLRIVKARFGLDAALVSPLLRKGQPPRGKNGEKLKAKPKPLREFCLAICRDPADRGNKAPSEVMDVLHDFGLVLLCALFLEKSQSAELITHFWDTGYGQSWNEEQRAIVKELIAVYRVRLPLQRLRSDESAQAITLDVLSELSRCPKPLFEALRKSDQQRFRTGTVPGAPDAKSVTDDPDASFLMTRGGERFIPLTMRLLDLDPKCKLRFAVDLGQFFFNVRLKPGDGFDDGRPRVRRLGQKIVEYGRLRDFLDAEKPQTWKRLEQNWQVSAETAERARAHNSGEIIELQPYIVQTEPHYHYHDDKIGIRLANDSNAKAGYPELRSELAEANSEHCERKGKSMEPDFWLSPAQMLHLAFYAHLQRKDNKSLTPDVLLTAYRGRLQRLLRKLDASPLSFDGDPDSPERRAAAQNWIDDIFDVHKSDHNPEVSLGELPKVVTRALLGTDNSELDVDAIRKRIAHLIEDSEKRIRRLDSMLQAFKKPGKPGFRPVKAGPVAVFLTEDLLRFQPVDAQRLPSAADPKHTDGGKINSQQYQILEAALAYYAIHLDEPPRILDLLKRAGLLGGPRPHLFLHKLGLEDDPDKFTSIMAFYRAYLRERIRFLERERGLARPANDPTHRWLRLRKPSSLDSWLDAVRDDTGDPPQLRALPVPADFFYRPILAATARVLDVNPEALLEEGTRQVEREGRIVTVRPALTWFLQCYLECQNDRPQEMYSYPRGHEVFDDCLDQRTKSHQTKQPFYGDEQQRRRKLAEIVAGRRGPSWKRAIDDEKLRKLKDAYRRRERHIRYLSTQDMALFQHGRTLFERHIQLPAGTAQPVWRLEDLRQTLLTTPINVELPVPNTSRFLRHPRCKISNLGELGLLVRDRRLATLLKYYPEAETVIDQAEIRAELTSYRRVRVQVMELVHTLEHAVWIAVGSAIGNDIAEGDRAVFGKDQPRHGKLLYQLQECWRTQPNAEFTAYADVFGADRFYHARLIRNAAAHNEYPDARLFREVVEAIAAEPVPKNPDMRRHVAERLYEALDRIYKPWLAFLNEVAEKQCNV